MRPLCTVVVDGLPSEGSSGSHPGPGSVSEMSLLHALGPVQTWLGQELEKCGIDAMIYTRYVLSLLLHDSYDYDLQEQVFTSLNCFVKLHGCVCTWAFSPESTFTPWAGSRALWPTGFRPASERPCAASPGTLHSSRCPLCSDFLGLDCILNRLQVLSPAGDGLTDGLLPFE